MLFNSQIFLIVFLPVVVLVFAALHRRRDHQLLALLAASLVFYAYWYPPMLALLIGSILVNWLIAGRIEIAPTRAAGWLAFGIAANLAVLGIYKYADFLAQTAAQFSGAKPGLFDLAMPLGISFFTFQQIAFLVDLRRGEADRPTLFRYGLFVSFFPQLIAGPIVRWQEIGKQFRDGVTDQAERWAMVASGLTLLVIGLAKKVLIADEIDPVVNAIFDAAGQGEVSTAAAWAGAVGFTLQIYIDFSAYSDMAIGLGRLFGIELPRNFNRPLRAVSIIDFWRRWHITLSEFLRDYLYIPLGGGRAGIPRQAMAVIVTMFLGGLWHGAAWTFVAWGCLHGFAIVTAHAARRMHVRPPALVGWALTLIFVIAAFVLFRAPDFQTAVTLWAAMIELTPGGLPSISSPGWRPLLMGSTSIDALTVLGTGLAMVLLLPAGHDIAPRLTRFRLVWAVSLAVAFCLLVIRLGNQAAYEFIYFQF